MKKARPTLPMSSRMQMASSTANTIKKPSGGNPVAKRIVNSASGKAVMGKNPYC